MSKEAEGHNAQAVLKKALLEIKSMRSRLEAYEKEKTEPIAIVGAGCRLPGDATTPEAFWHLLEQGVDAISDIPPDRWDVAAYYDPNPAAPGKMYMRQGGFLRRVDQFDASFFNISPREASCMDPQHRLLLEVSWEALEYAGIAPDRIAGSASGVFIGITNADYAQMQASADASVEASAYFATGSPLNFAAGRLAYMLGLQGPCMAVDTACSSSLVAVHLACQSLRAHECDMALVGGVNLMIAPQANIVLSKTRMLAPDGRCKTFDAAADGYGRGEGCGVIVLKRLSDAVKQGHRILALIRGSAVNQDGASSGLTVPNKQAQQMVIRQALANARVDPAEVSYVEAHGTGTSLGDPIEVRALHAALGQGRSSSEHFLLGSVKTNIGHLEAAAGIAGLLKVALSLQHKAIPPHLHIRTLNPYISWSDIPVSIPTTLTPWKPLRGKRIAGISSFGASGTNAHVILEEAPEVERMPVEEGRQERPVHLLTISARTEQALQMSAERYAASLQHQPAAALADMCFTASSGRSHFSHRIAVRCATIEEARQGLQTFASGEARSNVFHGIADLQQNPKVAFLFPGQGSQYQGMGRLLYETQPVFRQAVDQCNEILGSLQEQSLLSVLYPAPGTSSPLDETAYTQPALFAIEYALATLWRSWGIEPAYMMGHSVGEYVAACIAGVFSLEDALKLIAARARLMQALPRDGEMVALTMSAEQLAPYIVSYTDRVAIAAVNGPESVVLSGERGVVDEITRQLQADGVKATRLVVSHAFHSPLMEPMLAEFQRLAAEVTYTPPRMKLISNVTGAVVQGAEVCDPRYWVRHVREAVLFEKGMRSLHEQGVMIYLEVGPGRTLLGMGRHCIPRESACWLSSLRDGHNDWSQLVESLGMCYVRGVTINWNAFDQGYGRQRVVMPTYPFQEKRYWFTQSVAPQKQVPAAISSEHPFIGRRVPASLNEILYDFSIRADADALPIIVDHRIYGTIVVSGVVHLAMVQSALKQTLGEDCKGSFERILFSHPLILNEQEQKQLQVVLRPVGKERVDFQLYSYQPGSAVSTGADWVVHTTGTFVCAESEPSFAVHDHPLAIQQRCVEQFTDEEFYRCFWSDDEHYIGPSFRLVATLWRRDGEALAAIKRPVVQRQADDTERMMQEAAISEMAGQVLKAAVPTELLKNTDDGMYISVGFKKLSVCSAAFERVIWCHAVMEKVETEHDTIHGHLYLLDAEGMVVGQTEGVIFRRIRREVLVHQVRQRAAGRSSQRAVFPRETLRTASSTQKMELLERYVCQQISVVSEVPLAELDRQRPLSELGMDSFMAAELKSWLDEDMDIVMPVVELLQGPSIQQLTQRLSDLLALNGAVSMASEVSEVQRTGSHLGENTSSGTVPMYHSIDRWVLRPNPRPEAEMRLFCLPYGGGGASLYRPWAFALSEEIDVCPIQLPGREERLRETSFQEIEPLLGVLEEVIQPFLDKPFALFGCSMGALLGFELARRVRNKYGVTPTHLYAASYPAPHIESTLLKNIREGFAEGKDTEQLMKLYYARAERVIENQELLELFLPMIQADFRVVESYIYDEAPPLACPITVFGGTKDQEITREEFVSWYRHTDNAFTLHMFEQGHLFLRSEQARIVQTLEHDLLQKRVVREVSQSPQ